MACRKGNPLLLPSEATTFSFLSGGPAETSRFLWVWALVGLYLFLEWGLACHHELSWVS